VATGDIGQLARRAVRATALAMAAIWSGVDPPTSTQDIDLAMFGPFAHQPGGGRRRFVVFAQFVGQAGVGIDHDQRVGDLRQHAHMRAQLALRRTSS